MPCDPFSSNVHYYFDVVLLLLPCGALLQEEMKSQVKMLQTLNDAGFYQ